MDKYVERATESESRATSAYWTLRFLAGRSLPGFASSALGHESGSCRVCGKGAFGNIAGTRVCAKHYVLVEAAVAATIFSKSQ